MPNHPLLESLDESRVLARVREVIAGRGGARLMSELTGIPAGTLSKYLAGTSMPSFTNAAKIALVSRVPMEWLVGASDVTFSEASKLGTPAAVDTEDLVRIPVYDMRYSAGEGSSMALEELPPADDMAFSRRWLRGLGVNPEHAILDWAVGDSMWPTIPDGAAIIIDTSVREVRHGFIYAINLGGFLMVKRIARRTDGTVELISDNRDKYPVEIVPESRLAELHVVGRVYYVGHAL